MVPRLGVRRYGYVPRVALLLSILLSVRLGIAVDPGTLGWHIVSHGHPLPLFRYHYRYKLSLISSVLCVESNCGVRRFKDCPGPSTFNPAPVRVWRCLDVKPMAGPRRVTNRVEVSLSLTPRLAWPGCSPDCPIHLHAGPLVHGCLLPVDDRIYRPFQDSRTAWHRRSQSHSLRLVHPQRNVLGFRCLAIRKDRIDSSGKTVKAVPRSFCSSRTSLALPSFSWSSTLMPENGFPNSTCLSSPSFLGAFFSSSYPPSTS